MQDGVQVAWVYTLFMATFMGLLVGVTQRILGSPGDLPEVVHQIHTSGRIAISQAPSMFVCSAFSIAAGAEQSTQADPVSTCERMHTPYSPPLLHKGNSSRNLPCDGKWQA